MDRDKSREHISYIPSGVVFWLCKCNSVPNPSVQHWGLQINCSFFVFIIDLIFLNLLLDGNDRGIRIGFRGECYIPPETIRKLLCKSVIEFSFVRTISNNYFPIKILRFYLCNSNLLFLTRLKPSFLLFHKNNYLQVDINHRSTIYIINAMLSLHHNAERSVLKSNKQIK